MFNTFHFRNKAVVDFIKLGDLLGRSLRENVELFNINSELNTVSYVTESDKIITGKYNLSELSLSDIVVEDSTVFKDNEKFDKYVNERTGDFIGSIYTDNYLNATTSFNNLIKLWEQRLKFNNTKQKLEEKTAKFNVTNNIVKSKEFTQLSDLFPKLVEFLKNNKSKLEKISEITNSIKLSNTISKGFNIPKVTYEKLVETKTFKVTNPYVDTIYEMICTQELIKKEILENKNEFSDIWLTNPSIKVLALSINDKKDKIYEALANVVIDVPFIALASKKQIYEVLAPSINQEPTLNENLDDKDIKQYASRLFDLCKPIRKALIENLNIKYGVNILNLKEPASFKSLLNTQIVLFESLSRLSPKDSLLKEKLVSFTDSLKSKNGVQAIDLSEVINKLFVDAGYSIAETDMTKYINFDALAGELGNVQQILGMIKQVAAKGQALAGQNAPLANAPMQTNPMATPAPTPTNSEQPLGTEDDDTGEVDPNALGPEGEEEGQLAPGQGGIPGANPGMSPDSGGVPEEPAMPMSRDDLIATIQNLDMLTQELKSSLGIEDDMGGMYSEPGHMEPDGDEAAMGTEGEEGFEGEGEEGETEGEGEPNFGSEEESESPEGEESEDEEESAPPKKKEKPKSKEKKQPKGEE